MPALTLSAAQTVTIMGQSQSDLDLREKRIISRLDKQLEIIKRGILYRDERILIVNKPASVAHAAGSKTDIHMERLVDELRFGNQEPPRLVNVLEKGVSGILVLARSKSVWEYLTRIFSKPEVVERKVREHFAIRYPHEINLFGVISTTPCLRSRFFLQTSRLLRNQAKQDRQHPHLLLLKPLVHLVILSILKLSLQALLL